MNFKTSMYKLADMINKKAAVLFLSNRTSTLDIFKKKSGFCHNAWNYGARAIVKKILFGNVSIFLGLTFLGLGKTMAILN